MESYYIQLASLFILKEITNTQPSIPTLARKAKSHSLLTLQWTFMVNNN
jgi:hypothetical protein